VKEEVGPSKGREVRVSLYAKKKRKVHPLAIKQKLERGDLRLEILHKLFQTRSGKLDRFRVLVRKRLQ
jgi:hypothetical protein